MGPRTLISLEKEIVGIFMRRDGMTSADALERFRDAYINADEAICRGDSVEAVEERWMDGTGLGPDYLHSLLYVA